MRSDDVERVERQLELIRERIAERQSGTALGGQDSERLIDEASRYAQINAHWGIAPSWPVAGRIEVLAKRAIRILLRWYINPIVEQQNEFNASILRALYELESELHALRLDARDGRRAGRGTADSNE